LIFVKPRVIISYPKYTTTSNSPPNERERGGGRKIMDRLEKDEKEHASKHVDIESKRFFFDVKENHKGKYLRITELSGGRSCIVIPLGGINLFKERLGEVIQEAEKLIDTNGSI
jgi:hypothetical protein